MNKQTSRPAGRVIRTTWLKSIGIGFAAVFGLILLVPLGLWFAAQHRSARRRKAPSKKADATKVAVS